MYEQRNTLTLTTAFLLVLSFQFSLVSQASSGSIAKVPEVLRTQDWAEDNIDSVAVWRDGTGGGLLFVTAKSGDAIHVCDAATGSLVKTLRGEYDSDKVGSFNRPNSVGVYGDLLFVVERDNRRVQVLRIPSFETPLTFGQDCLGLPYGNTIVERDDGCTLYVTDNYELTEEGKHSVLTERVKTFDVTVKGDEVSVELVKSFGEPTGPGALNVVESIVADPGKKLLLIADESKRKLNVYDLEGRFTGTVAGKGIIKVEPEGMVVIPGEGAKGGHILVTDQGKDRTVIHVLSRDDYRHLGSFTGDPLLAATDGIAFTSGDFGPFKGGALYCVHQDTRVHAYSWNTIKEKLGLKD